MFIESSIKYKSSIFNTVLAGKKVQFHPKNGAFAFAMALGLTLGIVGQSWATPVGVNITKIVDTETSFSASAPTNRFYRLDPPTINNDEIAFVGNWRVSGNPFPYTGVFTSLGGSISTIDSINVSPYPYSFSEPSLSDGVVAYALRYRSPHIETDKLIVSLNGVNTQIDYTSFFQGGQSFSDPSVSEGAVVFSSNIVSDTVYSGSSSIRIYDFNNAGSSPVSIVTPDNLIPGGTGKFTRFKGPSISGGLIFFKGEGSNGEKGIYATDTNSTGNEPLTVVADFSTPIPGTTGNFADFGKPSPYINKVAFLGSDSTGLQGIYIGTGSEIKLVADTSTPSSNGTFTSFGDPVLSGNLIAFFGSDSNSIGGLYVEREDIKQNPMLKIIDTSDVLDGKTITELFFGHEGLSGNQLAFVANFSDGTTGIYKAEIATTTDKCKNNGHIKFHFRNQGQCVQFVQNGDDQKQRGRGGDNKKSSR
ncbi:MAG: hypothetical protein ACXWE4_10590 [Methylobacter sp.]